MNTFQQPTEDISITNLYFRTTVDEIYDAFSAFGTIVRCQLIVNDRGESKGYAFLKYQTSQEGMRAIQHMNNFKFNGRPIFVNWGTPKPNRRQ